jgi:hypothetical protein
MIGYSFLRAAEEEMSEAAVFYEAASVRLGGDFLEDVQLGKVTNLSIFAEQCSCSSVYFTTCINSRL